MTRHYFLHVLPPALAGFGLGNGIPKLLVLNLRVAEQFTRLLVEEDGVAAHTVREQRVLQLLPDGLMATRVLRVLAGMDGHLEGLADHTATDRTRRVPWP